MNKIFLATLALLLAAPAVAADTWNDDNGPVYVGDSDCNMSDLAEEPGCTLAYACTEGSPPQVVDTALHCSARLAGEAAPIAASVPRFAWALADANLLKVSSAFLAATAAAQPVADEFNTVGCSTIWSFFCANPVVLPSEMPVNDPVNGYPNALP